ncbi:signal peptidase II [Komagataeibacter rhaeticus]|uniref:signal peptidase II n=1 Tax=Komagataeibacter rhaeticus TaxID=215221 RepID=UPI000A019DC1|nr:signal peptidase II [Komagataeibacter rhaeticus]
MSKWKRIVFVLSIAGLVLLTDQITKAIVIGSSIVQDRGTVTLIPFLLNAVFTWNPGVTFGLLHNAWSWIVILPVTIGICAILMCWLLRVSATCPTIAGAAILGGALGNIIDRLRYGKVVDFLHLHLGQMDLFPYIFNIGDTAIVIGTATLLIFTVCQQEPEKLVSGKNSNKV